MAKLLHRGLAARVHLTVILWRPPVKFGRVEIHEI
jgi:hypothetical protein